MKRLSRRVVAIAFLLWLTLLMSSPPALVQAKEPDEPCAVWGHAGAIVIYRCVDEDNDNILYANNFGMMTLGQ